MKGSTNEEVIEANETYFVKTKTSRNTAKQHSAVCGLRPKNTPKDVATPFPPLKPAKIGKICPIIQQPAAIIR